MDVVVVPLIAVGGEQLSEESNLLEPARDSVQLRPGAGSLQAPREVSFHEQGSIALEELVDIDGQAVGV